jgi:carbamoyl-phosphate synthase large subunit
MTSGRVVLVTGVGGGGVGEQLVKALRLAEHPYWIVGTDAQPRSLSLFEVDVPVLLPLASAPDYGDALLDVCKRYGVRAVYPGSEPELVVLARERARFASAGVLVFANTDQVIATGLDKAGTAVFLSANGFSSPRTMLVTRPDETIPFLPAVLKPNTGGGGSANTFVAQTESEARLFTSLLLAAAPSFLAQEYVGTADDEYTVGVLSDLDGAIVSSIAVRRNILSAFSNRSRSKNRTGNPAFGDQLVISNGISQGDIGQFPDVTSVCERIAKALGSRGPLNIQCRFVDGKVLVFEINPRFSGTASLRALVGFNEPDLLYRRHIENEKLESPVGYREGHVVRGLREVLVDPSLASATVGAGDFRWRIEALPFVYRHLETPDNNAGLPNALPITMTVDTTTGLVRQLRDPVVADAVERAYVAGSEIAGLMEGQGIGKEYADDFLALLAEAGIAVDGTSVLDVGCGTGYLLSRLRDLGAKVLGVEPGPHGQSGAAKHGVPIVQGFFPCKGVSGTFDRILLYLVLEHLDDPSALLGAVRSHLAPNGQVVVVVPDTESFLEEGDVSVLFHEHYAYFTAASLAAVLRRVGARGIRIRRSTLSKLLFASFSFDLERPDGVAFDRPLVDRVALAHRFRASASRITGLLARYLAEARALGESVGVYVPGRFVNYVALGALPIAGFRFFDDSALLHGKYFPGVPIPVENGDELAARPTSRVLVMSTSFGAKIKARIAPRLPSSRVTTLDELLRDAPR